MNLIEEFPKFPVWVPYYLPYMHPNVLAKSIDTSLALTVTQTTLGYFCPLNLTQILVRIRLLQPWKTASDIWSMWMLQDRLMINDDKTEFHIVGTKQQLSKLSIYKIKVGDTSVTPSKSVLTLV